jgi:hypothetical protein
MAGEQALVTIVNRGPGIREYRSPSPMLVIMDTVLILAPIGTGCRAKSCCASRVPALT